MNTDPRQLKLEFRLAIVTLVLIMIGQWLGLIKPLKTQLERFSQPVMTQVGRKLFQVKRWGRFLHERQATIQHLEELEQAYSQALAKIIELEALETENQELRRLLNVSSQLKAKALASAITAYGQPSLNLGSEAGLEVGQPVLAAETLVGLIKETSSHQAQVELLAQNQTQPLLAETESGVAGLVIGDGQKILLTEIDKSASVQVGEVVMTSGQSGIDSQLVIGQVLQIINRPAAPTQEAVLEQAVSFHEVPAVEVLL